MSPVASDAAASIESVTTTPLEAHVAAQEVAQDRRGLRRDVIGVERGIPRMADHHERHAGLDRGRERAAGRRRSSSSRERSIVAGPSSVLTVAPPRPGKCLAVARTPPARQPRDRLGHRLRRGRGVVGERAARQRRAVDGGHVADRRERDVDPVLGSARGPRRGRRSGPCPAACCAGAAASGGAHGRMRISPPSWSTMTSVSSPPAPRRLRVSARSCSGEVTLSRKRITPAARRSAQRVEHVVRRRRAGEAQDDHLADLLAEAQAVDGLLAAAARPGAGRACCRRRSASPSARRRAPRPSPPPPAPTTRPTTNATSAPATSRSRRRRTEVTRRGTRSRRRRP